MSDISRYIETIRTATYGKDMREALYKCIYELNKGCPGFDEYGTFTNFVKDLHPEYTLFEQRIQPQSQITSCLVDSEVYRESMTVWKNDDLLSRNTDYSVNQAGTSFYEVVFNEALIEGDEVVLQFWTVPKADTRTFGVSIARSTGISSSIYGVAETEENEEGETT